MRHFDVQLIGGIVLHQGRDRGDEDRRGQDAGRDAAAVPQRARVARARTSSPSTITWHDATPDGTQRCMTSSGCRSGSSPGRTSPTSTTPSSSTTTHPDPRLQHLRPCTRREAYAADITYSTNNELGFDYLRDNMAQKLDRCVQRRLHFAIVDEVDSILIDEARTPLIISGQASEATDKFYTYARSDPAARRRG